MRNTDTDDDTSDTDEESSTETEPIKWAAIVSVLLGGTGSLILGYDFGVANGMEEPLTAFYNLTDTEFELFVGVFHYMCIPGSFAAGFLADQIGRRPCLGLGAVLMIIACGLMALATGFWMVVMGRAVGGFATGLLLSICPLYTAETVPARVRGMANAIFEISINFGVFIAYCASWYLKTWPNNWRWEVGICVVIPVVTLLGVIFVLSESPRWLAMKARWPETKSTLHRLIGPEEAGIVYEKLQRGSGEEEEQLSWCQMISSQNIRKIMFIGAGIALFQQATGTDSIVIYSNQIMKADGISDDASQLGTMGIGLAKLLMIVVASQVVDELGRKPLLVMSGIGITVSLLCLALACQFGLGIWFVVLPMVCCVSVFSLGWGPCCWIVNAEIYPGNCRAKGVALAVGTNRLTSAMVASSWLSLKDFLGEAGAFLFYTAIGCVTVAFAVLAVPETKGTQLEDAHAD